MSRQAANAYKANIGIIEFKAKSPDKLNKTIDIIAVNTTISMKYSVKHL